MLLSSQRKYDKILKTLSRNYASEQYYDNQSAENTVKVADRNNIPYLLAANCLAII